MTPCIGSIQKQQLIGVGTKCRQPVCIETCQGNAHSVPGIKCACARRARGLSSSENSKLLPVKMAGESGNCYPLHKAASLVLATVSVTMTPLKSPLLWAGSL